MVSVACVVAVLSGCEPDHKPSRTSLPLVRVAGTGRLQLTRHPTLRCCFECNVESRSGRRTREHLFYEDGLDRALRSNAAQYQW